ncbi:Sensor histidine kinase [Vibrio crassostreae]|nr:Sensor histidine kinase [Vibrio crassostreae]CAK3502840.1 Sensor histidine kinase [Vibrio crassostreae]
MPANSDLSGGRHLLPSAVSLRTQRATFTALGSSLHKGIV